MVRTFSMACLAARRISVRSSGCRLSRRRPSTSLDRSCRSRQSHPQGQRLVASGRSIRAPERLAKCGAAGRALEAAILDSTALAESLAGDAKDPYRADLPERVRAARTVREETLRKLGTERAGIAEELTFLDAEGVSSAPDGVMLVVRTLREAGI